MARTNWEYNEIVTEDDFNSIGQEINDNAADIVELQEKLAPADPIPVTIPLGVSIVNADRKSRFKDMKITGRTLVNLLGRDGNCEEPNKWNILAGSLTLDPSNKTTGNNGFKTTGMAASNYGHISVDIKLNVTKSYILLADVKGGSTNDISVRLFDPIAASGMRTSRTAATPAAFKTVYVKSAPNLFSGTNPIYCDVITVGSDTAFAYVDSIRIYEISQTEYNALDTMTAEQIAAKYPYVDDMKHVNAVYVQNPGKNLFPPSSNCTAFAGTLWNANAPYSVTDVKPTSGAYDIFGFYCTVVPGQIYTISSSVTSIGPTGSGGYLDVQLVADDGTPSAGTESSKLQSGTLQVTYAIPTDIHKVRVSLVVHGDTTGTFTFSDFQMNIGSTAIPFTPQQPSYMYLPDCNLRSNVAGSVADQLYMDGYGKLRAVRRFREIVLDGSLSWYGNGNPNTTSKNIQITSDAIPNAIKNEPNTTKLVRYNGSIAPYGAVGGGLYQFNIDDTGKLNINILNNDSGWGQDYTPTQSEIKAYFNGWRMYVAGTSGDLYNGTGTKSWAKLYCGVGTVDNTWPGSPVVAGSGSGGVLPLTTNDMGYTPYRLMYPLAQSVDEPINYEGELMLHEGPNQIEMGTGVVVREAAEVAARQYINALDAADGSRPLSKRVARFVAIYKDGSISKEFAILPVPPVGIPRAGNFYGDAGKAVSAAAYSVTYLALDTYLLGIAPTSITGFVTPNIKETVDDAVQAITGLRRDMSAMQATKAGKQQPQVIVPTLLSGATFVRGGYYKGDTGRVYLDLGITGGLASEDTLILKLPKGYRPGSDVLFEILASSAGIVTAASIVEGKAYLLPDGNLRIWKGGTGYMHFLLSFRAEQ